LSIYHITTREDWDAALGGGSYEPPSVAAEGFIHCSAPDQVVETANLLFRGQQGLVLLVIDPDRLVAHLHYEQPTPSGEDSHHSGLFPHIYGTLNLNAVTAVVDFPGSMDGSFAVPPNVGDDTSMR
jgi:uncharacterized protein (DUF952 family)